MASSGRPSKLTAELVQKFSETMASGVSLSTAAKLLGVVETTARSWYVRGKDAPKGLQRDFFEKVNQAEAMHEKALADVAHKAAKIDPLFALRVLERRHPDRWGRKQFADVTTRDETQRQGDGQSAAEHLFQRITAQIESHREADRLCEEETELEHPEVVTALRQARAVLEAAKAAYEAVKVDICRGGGSKGPGVRVAVSEPEGGADGSR